MHETYRMLGREREADLERQARKWQRADAARTKRQVGGGHIRPSRPSSLPSFLRAAWLARDAGLEIRSSIELKGSR